MAEVGNMPLPPKVLRKGISDMVRVSDARMSGTAYGTVVLHAAPEAAAGGPLAFVQTGDWVTLDTRRRKLSMEVSDADLARRKEGRTPPKLPLDRGYWKLYIDHVLGAGFAGESLARSHQIASLVTSVPRTSSAGCC